MFLKGYDGVISSERAQEIAKEYYDEIFSFCYSNAKFNKYDAEVLTQDVFLLFQEKCNDLNDDEIKHWLMVVAKNKTKEYYREKKKDMSVLSLDEAVFEIAENDIQKMFEDNLPDNNEDTEKYIKILLKALTPKERDLYHKMFVEKKTYKQIAEETNTNESTVASRARRLKIRIRAIIKLMFSTFGQFIIRLFFW